MTLQEFSSEFDILYNNIMSNSAPGLDEYEKSVLLTQAQEAIVQKIYNGTFNTDSFENTEEVKSYLECLIRQVTLTETIKEKGISVNSKLYSLPENLWFIIYESANISSEDIKCNNGVAEVIVTPITHDSYYKISNNPFRKDSTRRVLRLSYDNKIELISSYNIDSYLIRYIEKPEPIILVDLDEYDATINDMSTSNECKLPEVLHRTILISAVELAKALWK